MTHDITRSKRKWEHELRSIRGQILMNFPLFSKHLAKPGFENTKTGNNGGSSKMDFKMNAVDIE